MEANKGVGYPHPPTEPGFNVGPGPQENNIYPNVPPTNTGGYPNVPPPGGYPNAPPPKYEDLNKPPVAVITHTVVTSVALPSEPTALVCPSCREHIVTKVKYEAGTKTHLFALLLCIVFWPCVCVPYCVESCNNANHYCPNCGTYIGANTN